MPGHVICTSEYCEVHTPIHSALTACYFVSWPIFTDLIRTRGVHWPFFFQVRLPSLSKPGSGAQLETCRVALRWLEKFLARPLSHAWRDTPGGGKGQQRHSAGSFSGDQTPDKGWGQFFLNSCSLANQGRAGRQRSRVSGGWRSPPHTVHAPNHSNHRIISARMRKQPVNTEEGWGQFLKWWPRLIVGRGSLE